MNNLREVNDDLLKDWLLFREDEISSLSVMRIEIIGFILMRFLIKFWIVFLKRIELLFKNNLVFLMIISWIILLIGMRSIIGMGFVMECSWLRDAVTIMFHFKVQNLHFEVSERRD